MNKKNTGQKHISFLCDFFDAKLDEKKRNKREGLIEMADGSLLLDVCLSQQEQWMKDEVEMESGLLDVCLSQARSVDERGMKNRHKLDGRELDKIRDFSWPFLTTRRLRVFFALGAN